MSHTVQIFRAKVNPENVTKLLQVRPQAIAQAQQACPVLVRAELVRLDEETWLDILTWSEPDGPDQLMRKAADLSLLHEMHALVGEVLTIDTGELAHTSQA